MAAEGAFLNDPAGPARDISVEHPLHLLRPFRFVPVEIFYRIWTGRCAVTTPNAAMIDLGNESLWVEIRRINRADLGAGRIITMHAGPWKEPSFDIRILSFNIGDQFHPMNGTALF